MTGDSGNIWCVGPEDKMLPKAEGNILSEGPTYHMLPKLFCYIAQLFCYTFIGLGWSIVSKLYINELNMIKLASIWMNWFGTNISF